jgi:hypothetical protein
MLSAEAALANVTDKLNALVSNFNDFKLETKLKDQDLGETIYQLRLQAHDQQSDLNSQRSEIHELHRKLAGGGTGALFSGDFAPFGGSSEVPSPMILREKKTITEEIWGMINLSLYATKEDLKNYATKEDLTGYAKQSELSQYVKSSVLVNYLTVEQLSDLNLVSTKEAELMLKNPSTASDVEARLIKLEDEVFDPAGALHRLEEQYQELLSRKGSKSVTIGGVTFKDQHATHAWARMLPGSDVVKYFVDARLQLGALNTRLTTEEDIIKGEADAKKAGFDSHDGAITTASFSVTYPSTIFRGTTNAKDAVRGGLVFTSPWATAKIFEGDSENSPKADMLSALSHNRDQHQAAIDLRFPADQPKFAKAHAIASAILRLGYFQAVGFIDSILPFNKMMVDAGLDEPNSWLKCLTYARAVCYRIFEVRTISKDRTVGAMIFGMMNATVLLEGYGTLGWIRHPDVSSALVVASLQREGKKASGKQVDLNKSNIQKLEERFKKLEDKNPSLNK